MDVNVFIKNGKNMSEELDTSNIVIKYFIDIFSYSKY